MGPLILQQTGSPKQIYERQMVAANERGEREGAMEGSLEGGGKVKRGEMGNMPVDIIKVGCGAV